jgi:hypothetical protein
MASEIITTPMSGNGPLLASQRKSDKFEGLPNKVSPMVEGDKGQLVTLPPQSLYTDRGIKNLNYLIGINKINQS